MKMDPSKMTHIDEFTLNEYLDEALPETERQTIEAHLAVCASCQAELAELQQLFLALDAVPDLAPTSDLSAVVEAQIAQQEAVNSEQFTVNSWPLLIFEVIAAGVLLFLLWPTVQEWLLLARSWQAQFTANVTWPTPVLWSDMSGQITAVFDQLQSLPPLDLATIQWIVLLGAALIIWLAGNRLLFTSPPQNGGSHG